MGWFRFRAGWLVKCSTWVGRFGLRCEVGGVAERAAELGGPARVRVARLVWWFGLGELVGCGVGGVAEPVLGRARPFGFG